MINYFPFKIIDEIEGLFEIIAETESKDLYSKYAGLFEESCYSGNGKCWEGHIIQILEEINPELLKNIDFASEPEIFSAFTYTKETQIKFVELLSPIFADLAKLKECIILADRSRIQDKGFIK